MRSHREAISINRLNELEQIAQHRKLTDLEKAEYSILTGRHTGFPITDDKHLKD